MARLRFKFYGVFIGIFIAYYAKIPYILTLFKLKKLHVKRRGNVTCCDQNCGGGFRGLARNLFLNLRGLALRQMNNIKLANKAFEIVIKFKYLGKTVTK
jgi:hypothetical protein